MIFFEAPYLGSVPGDCFIISQSTELLCISPLVHWIGSSFRQGWRNRNTTTLEPNFLDWWGAEGGRESPDVALEALQVWAGNAEKSDIVNRKRLINNDFIWLEGWKSLFKSIQIHWPKTQPIYEYGAWLGSAFFQRCHLRGNSIGEVIWLHCGNFYSAFLGNLIQGFFILLGTDRLHQLCSPCLEAGLLEAIRFTN